jgi:hypothetical protein
VWVSATILALPRPGFADPRSVRVRLELGSAEARAAVDAAVAGVLVAAARARAAEPELADMLEDIDEYVSELEGESDGHH